MMVTTDGAPVMPDAIRFLGLPWVNYGAHAVNLAVGAGNELQDVVALRTLVRAVRSQVVFFEAHPKRVRVLRKKQLINFLKNHPGLSLIKDCDTRWNSIPMMID
jgi:hypothetical protein